MELYVGVNTRSYRRSLIPDYCEIPGCDFKYCVTKHRIKPGRNKGKYEPGNVIGLCPNHHFLADHGFISTLTLFQIVYDRLRGSKE